MQALSIPAGFRVRERARTIFDLRRSRHGMTRELTSGIQPASVRAAFARRRQKRRIEDIGRLRLGLELVGEAELIDGGAEAPLVDAPYPLLRTSSVRMLSRMAMRSRSSSISFLAPSLRLSTDSTA